MSAAAAVLSTLLLAPPVGAAPGRNHAPGRLIEVLDRDITPAGVRAVRPDAVFLNGRFYVGFSQMRPHRSFGIITLDRNLKTLDVRPVCGRKEPGRMPTDLRLAPAEGRFLWCLFETVSLRTPEFPEAAERNFLYWARYSVASGLPVLDRASEDPAVIRAGGFPPPPETELTDDPLPLFRGGSYHIATRTWGPALVTVRALDRGLEDAGRWRLDLRPALGPLSLSVYAIVDIARRPWLVGSAFNGPPIEPEASSYLMAVPLSDDLRRATGPAVTLSRNREYQQYVAAARYASGKLYVAHNIFPGDKTSQGRLKVFDARAGFRLLAEALINDGRFPGDDHVTLEVVDGKIHVFYPTPQERLRVKVFRWREASGR